MTKKETNNMMYRGSSFVELIAFCPNGEPENTHFIEMHKGDGMFWVTYCCDADWCYEFYMYNQSDYERVKFNIMEAIFECEDTDELLNTLSEIFQDGFADILIEDECDGDCENCECHENDNETNKYLN